MGKRNFPTTYTEEGLVGKLGRRRPLVTPPRNFQLPHHLYRRGARGEAGLRNFPTTYTEEGLVGKLPRKAPGLRAGIIKPLTV